MEPIKNVIIFLTDQERALQHFPPGWEKENLKGLTRLKEKGLTFERAFTNSCMCSPARSTWMSGYFPAQHGVKYTLESTLPPKGGAECNYPQVPLKTPGEGLKNIATVMAAAGFNVVYKGKWHCSKPRHNDKWVPQDLADYGFSRWNPQDAGANQEVEEGGGAPGTSWKMDGEGNNDERFMRDHGDMEAGKEGVLAYLGSLVASKKKGELQKPFCLIISLVNPHDVLFYPGEDSFEDSGYSEAPPPAGPPHLEDWLDGTVEIPVTENENLESKPRVQSEFLRLSQGLGRLETDAEKKNYINYYGNLMRSSDSYLVEVLDTLGGDLLDETLIIRTADHGEMGLTHGGQRQKNFNFYEESIRVPLVYSNPGLFKEAQSSDALVSHVDFLPTLASLFDTPPDARTEGWEGVDYSGLVRDPGSEPVQDYIVFTYDDYQSGQAFRDLSFYPNPPNHIVSIREQRYKLAKYYDASEGSEIPPQWEMYDLWMDHGLETTNLAYDLPNQSDEVIAEFKRLRKKLDEVCAERLQPLGEDVSCPGE